MTAVLPGAVTRACIVVVDNRGPKIDPGHICSVVHLKKIRNCWSVYGRLDPG